MVATVTYTVSILLRGEFRCWIFGLARKKSDYETVKLVLIFVVSALAERMRTGWDYMQIYRYSHPTTE